ncbi:hypothetical protein RchiOBHm_Chr3g0459971 [Rosa chinensis]|uniref:Uncharacterized protein n=1 Tax=Rosa chinensis TaxID=74649 RepID=A0A2P6R8A9_ROSCH|nr:hypothetical protein RchiOBHm_Chr3g0459971 [Rosa chinensis]
MYFNANAEQVQENDNVNESTEEFLFFIFYFYKIYLKVGSPNFFFLPRALEIPGPALPYSRLAGLDLTLTSEVSDSMFLLM